MLYNTKTKYIITSKNENNKTVYFNGYRFIEKWLLELYPDNHRPKEFKSKRSATQYYKQRLKGQTFFTDELTNYPLEAITIHEITYQAKLPD